MFIELKNYPYYFACTDGNIYSKKGRGMKKDSYDNEYLKLKPSKSSSSKGYLQINLPCKNSKSGYNSKFIHRLIAESFIGVITKDKTVSHIDGNKYNNNPSNLTIESLSDNIKRKYEHNTMDNGFNNSRSLISKEQLLEIRTHLKNGILTHEQIGKLFNVSRVFITKINTNQRYKNC